MKLKRTATLALAALGEDLLQALAGGRLGEIAGLRLGAVAHLGLKEGLAFEAHGAQGDAEGLALARQGLGEADEARPEDTRADFLAQLTGQCLCLIVHGVLPRRWMGRG